jgi:L-lactate dehydrogenase complex protein LldF
VQQATDRFVGGRAARVAELPQWEQLRQIGSDIRLHTIENMDVYLTRLEEKVKAAGGHVHWAQTAEEANRIVLQIAKEHNVKTAVKSKSMATEEIGLNHALEEAGIEALETDLGEYIIQLAGTGPSHIIVPAVHLNKEEIAAIFSEKLKIHAPADAIELTRIAREVLREKFLNAEMGISGGNFLIAETGTLVLVTNEGNGRMCTTMPDLHVAVVGIDKVIPDWESLTVFLKLLARSATGQKLSTYTQFITGPRRAEGEFGPKEFHLVLLDNNRSRVLKDPRGREVFKCIRCGACANVCPVYKNVGLLYGWFISIRLAQFFHPRSARKLARLPMPPHSVAAGGCAKIPFRQPRPPPRAGDDLQNRLRCARPCNCRTRLIRTCSKLDLPLWDTTPASAYVRFQTRWLDSECTLSPQSLDKSASLATVHCQIPPMVERAPHQEGFLPMTNPVIENVRRSLGRTAQAPLEPRPAIHESRQAESVDSEIETFLNEIRKLSGVGQKLSPSEIVSVLKALIEEQNVRKATVWETPHLRRLGIAEILNSLGVELVSPNAGKHAMAQCDLGITEADFLLPETGTLVLRSSAEKPRAVSLLPRIHLAIVRPEMLRADMHQVFEEAKDQHYLVFITGPSRTADIELTVTLGVHGPKNLYVWLMSS